MSYPISNTSDFTIQQMEVLTKARFDSGIHIILTNPFVSEKVSQNSTEVTVCQLARGIQNGTNLTHAFCFPQQSSTEAKFRFRADDRDSGNETGKYMEYHMSPGGTHFYVRNVGKGKSVGTMSTALNMKMPVVLQMEVPDDGCIKEMRPAANALDIIQGDNNVFMGTLLPTLAVVLEKLESTQETELRFCRPLVDALPAGVKAQFGSLMARKDLIIATALMATFETNLTWLSVREQAALYEQMKHEVGQWTRSEPTASQADESDDFFSVLDETNFGGARAQELESFLSLPRDAPLSAVITFPAIARMFVKYNTGLPSSPSVERMFSAAGDVLIRKRLATPSWKCSCDLN
ncbi:uncharacterized protein LOC135391325 isoform X1 [Ornithodoros turicata]|uniref:uncharacterized protein LOC135391325 isoform X1 n=1 Tax=Ornithodoros turicata TaxID=34597 RepID=UPI00313878BA